MQCVARTSIKLFIQATPKTRQTNAAAGAGLLGHAFAQTHTNKFNRERFAMSTCAEETIFQYIEHQHKPKGSHFSLISFSYEHYTVTNSLV